MPEDGGGLAATAEGGRFALLAAEWWMLHNLTESRTDVLLLEEPDISSAVDTRYSACNLSYLSCNQVAALTR